MNGKAVVKFLGELVCGALMNSQRHDVAHVQVCTQRCLNFHDRRQTTNTGKTNRVSRLIDRRRFTIVVAVLLTSHQRSSRGSGESVPTMMSHHRNNESSECR